LYCNYAYCTQQQNSIIYLINADILVLKFVSLSFFRPVCTVYNLFQTCSCHETIKSLVHNFATASMAERLTSVPRVREVDSSNPRQAISYTALQAVRHHLNIYASSCGALSLCDYVAEIGTVNSLHALA